MEPPETILVVEDHDAVRESLAELLSFDRHVVVTTRSVLEALGALETTPRMCLLILDLVMDGNGRTFLRTLRERADLKGIPVIVLTGQNILRDRLAEELGVPQERCFLKPCDPLGLIRIAREHCARPR